MSTHSFTQYHTFFYGYFVLTSTRGKCIIYSDYCIRPDQGDISMEKTKIAKPEKDKLELHELLQRIALIVGFVAIFVAIIATNARNEGCFTIRYSKDTGNLLYTLFVFSAKSDQDRLPHPEAHLRACRIAFCCLARAYRRFQHNQPQVQKNGLHCRRFRGNTLGTHDHGCLPRHRCHHRGINLSAA